MCCLRTLVIALMLLCPSSVLALVNINTASLEELDTLPGVGPATAEKIIAARPFSSTSDIQHIQGIGGPGTKTYDDIIGLITVSGSTSVVDDEGEEVSLTKTAENQTKKIYTPVNSLKLSAPEVAHVNQRVEFVAEPSDGQKGRLVRYHWNFGDGNIAEVSNPTHVYKYPGTYIVVVESYYLKETRLARHEIEVLPTKIKVTKGVGNQVTLTNEGDEEIDLFGMTVSGSGEFTFPKHSFLMPGKSVTVQLSGNYYSPNVVLHDQAGQVVKGEVSSATTRTSNASSKTVSVPEVSSETKVPLIGPVAEASEDASNTAAATNSGFDSNHWPYLGLLLLVGLGLFSLFGSKKNVV